MKAMIISRLFIILSLALQLIHNPTYADIDNKCTQNCQDAGYSWSFCNEKCSFNNPTNRNLSPLIQEYVPSGLVGGIMKGIEDGQRQALIQEQIENQRLRNELLKKQLDAQQDKANKQDINQAAHEQYNLKNYIEAARLYSISASQGNPNAQYSLGYLYSKGLGLQQSFLDAAYWYNKSAAQGNANALNSLATLYYSGNGVSKNLSEATRLARIAAERGHAVAQFNMGFIYERGINVQIDLNEALIWYRKSAAQGHKNAIRKLSELERQ